ncbi:MAG: hypothetical protein ABL921_01105 [Pirellula sp.]
MDPLSAEIRRTAAVIYYRLGQWQSHRGIAESIQNFQRWLNFRKEAISADTKNDRKRLDQMLASAAVGNIEVASTLIDEYVANAKIDNEMRVDIARAASRLSGFVESINENNWADTATNMLQKAIDSGYSDPIYFGSELDFSNLRDKPSFTRLIQQLDRTERSSNAPL